MGGNSLVEALAAGTLMEAAALYRFARNGQVRRAGDQIDGKAAESRYFFFHFVPSKAGFSFMIKQLRRLVNAFSFAA